MSDINTLKIKTISKIMSMSHVDLNKVLNGGFKIPDIDYLFMTHFENIGAMSMASKLGHSGTSRVCRWYKEGEVPCAHKYAALKMLDNEGVIS